MDMFANLGSGVNIQEDTGGSCGKCKFDFIRNNQTVFQSGIASSFPIRRVSVAPQAHQHLVSKNYYCKDFNRDVIEL